MRKILLTGASGYLGSELIKQLSETNDQVFALTSNREKVLSRHSKSANLRIFKKEELENDLLRRENINCIIHCAFARKGNEQEIAESLAFTNELFIAAVKTNVREIINISSQRVYGQINKPPWTEETPVAPFSLYGLAKYASELLLNRVSLIRNYELHKTNLRLASLSGGCEGLTPELISKFVNKALNDEPIMIFGGKQVFSYLDIRDAASAIIRVLSTDSKIWKETYNLGNNYCLNIVEIAGIVCDVAKKFINHPVKIEIENKDINQEIGMDSSLFYNDFKWHPKYDMKATVESLFGFLRKPIDHKLK